MGPVVSERNQKQVITASLICQRKLSHQLLSEALNGCFQKLHRCPVLLAGWEVGKGKGNSGRAFWGRKSGMT